MKKLLLIALLFITATSFGQIIVKQSNKVNNLNTVWIGSGGTAATDTANAVMVIKRLGNVGIGTSSPAEKLHVNGSVRIDSTLILNSEYETSTDSTFTVPVNVSNVNSDKGSDWVSGTITLPANPVNGQIISLSGQYATVTIAGQGGATVSYQPGSAQIHHGMKYRYWASDNSWRPW